ncbi:MAG TPA: hypothetical protein VK961_27760 [Chthoniobacter sp.]|nr:hypothetical protein [Chthoniobacter sp.]
MSALYKIQVRKQLHQPFEDYVDWCSCEDCITKLRNIFDRHPEWDLQVVDERKNVVTSTLEQAAPHGMPGASYN